MRRGSHLISFDLMIFLNIFVWLAARTENIPASGGEASPGELPSRAEGQRGETSQGTAEPVGLWVIPHPGKREEINTRVLDGVSRICILFFSVSVDAK